MENQVSKNKVNNKNFVQANHNAITSDQRNSSKAFFFFLSSLAINGKVQYSNDSLAAGWGCSKRTVQRQLKKLQAPVAEFNQSPYILVKPRKSGKFQLTNEIIIIDNSASNKNAHLTTKTRVLQRGGGVTKVSPNKECYSNTLIIDNVLNIDTQNSLALPVQTLGKETMSLVQKGETLSSPKEKRTQIDSDTQKLQDQLEKALKQIPPPSATVATEKPKIQSQFVATQHKPKTQPPPNCKTKWPLNDTQQRIYDDIKSAIPSFDYDSLCVIIRTKKEKDLRDTLFHLKRNAVKLKNIKNHAAYFRSMINAPKITSDIEENRKFVEEWKIKCGWHTLEIGNRFATCKKFDYDISLALTRDGIIEVLKQYDRRYRNDRAERKKRI